MVSIILKGFVFALQYQNKTKVLKIEFKMHQSKRFIPLSNDYIF